MKDAYYRNSRISGSAAMPPRGPGRAAQLLSLGGLLVLLVWGSGCGPREVARSISNPDRPPVEVKVETVEAKKSAAHEEVVGTVRAKLHATLEAKATGRITAMPVVLGQHIQAGDLLVRLDAPEIKARLEQAEAGQQQAAREWKRVSSLFDQQASTRAEYDAAEARFSQAKGAVAEAQAMLSYVEIRAPFSGVVTRKAADLGDLATPGKPLVELEDPAHLQLEADVPEALAGNIAPQARLEIRPGEGAAVLTGTVAEIAPNADPVSRTFRIKLDLPAPGVPDAGPSLRSGQFARLAVPLGECSSLRVPASAVVQRGQLEIVFAVENQRAQLRLVKTGRQAGGEIEILSGLESGQTVVTENASQLVDDQPVAQK